MELRSLGLRPIFEVIEKCPEENWQERERFWITHYGGIRTLLNARLGGELNPPRSSESYEAIAEKLRGVARSEETKNKISESLVGHEVLQKTKEKLRKANGVQFTDPISAEKHRQGMLEWWTNLSDDKKERVLEGSEFSRKNGLGVKAMQERIVSMSESERVDWISRSHAWLSDPKNSDKQRAKSMKRWANPEAHIVGPQSEEHKQSIKSSMKSFWSSKTPEERSAIAKSNWAKRRAKAANGS